MSSVSWSVDDGGGEGDGPGRVFLAPPRDELGRPLDESFVLARTGATAVVVQTVRVHSTGCLLDVEWIRRRQAESDVEWDARQREAQSSLMDLMEDHDGLTIRVDPIGSIPNVLGTTGASLRSDEHRITGTLSLWLTPLPTASSTRLVCSWERYGIERTAHDIDVTAVHDAARKAASVWD